MRLPGRGKDKSPSVDVRQIVLGALASALNDGSQQESEKEGKKGLTGVRAVAAGAALVTAGRAAYKGREFIRERLGRDDEDEPVDEAEYEEYEDEEYEEDEEPEARG